MTQSARRLLKGWFALNNKHRQAAQYASIALLMGTITCGPIDVISIEETSTTTIEKASIFEQLLGDIGFGAFLNLKIIDNTELQNQGVEPHQIDSVYATQLTLTILEPEAGQDFSFIESLEFFVSSDGLEKVRIASLDGIPDGATVIELVLDPVDLAPYAAADSMTVTSYVDGQRPEYDTLIEAKMTLDVDINVGGLICGAPSDTES